MLKKMVFVSSKFLLEKFPYQPSRKSSDRILNAKNCSEILSIVIKDLRWIDDIPQRKSIIESVKCHLNNGFVIKTID